MTFERKKLNTETLSEYLRTVREHLSLSAEQVSAKTGIKPAFLASLEDGKFLKLPPDVYVKGFLKQLAALYGIQAEALVQQYQKERGIQQQIHQPASREGSWKNKILGKLVITPKSVSLAGGVLFVAVSLGYIIWQVSSINQAPSLEIFQPKDRQVIKGSVVDVMGKTDPGMTVTVNGQNVFVDSQGNFKTQLGITAGPKDLALTAKNKFDKSVSKTVSVVAEDQADQADGQVQLKLEFSDDVTVDAATDGGLAQTSIFHNGEVKQYAGQKNITISVSDAGATKATLNGQLLGILGRSKEALKSISFFPDNNSTSTAGQ